jgi:hypothetical protein
VIDSPPVTAMADAAVLSVLCDGVIVVVNGQSTPAALARQAMDRLAVVQARILGVVLNGVDIRNPEYAYYQSYQSYVDPPAARTAEDNGHAKDNGQPKYNGDAQHYGTHSQESGESPVKIHLSDVESLARNFKSGHVPQEFFEQMVYDLWIAAGPNAAMIVEGQIKKMGETREAFPKERLQELLDEVCREIFDENLRNEFLKSMQGELRSLSREV